MYGISFNDKHSYRDFDITILNTRVIETPSKIKIKETVPFMNGSYDFSNLYGGACFSERKLEYEFLLKSKDSINLEVFRMKVDNWLMGTNNQTKLVDDNLVGYYYLAECENVDFEDLIKFGKLKATFIAYPFKISDSEEGNNLWDSFNFELDVLQESSFDITGSNTINIYNRSATNIIPSIYCSSNMEIVKDGITYKLDPGTSKDYRLKLNMGNNKMAIKGNGSIEFKFRAEVL